MAHSISEELALIINLKNTAIHHKNTCQLENCGVSLMSLKMAAINIARWVRTYERSEAESLINEMPIL